MTLLRRYEPGDADVVWWLHKDNVPHDAGDGPGDDDMRDIRQAYLDGGGEFLVAELEGEVVESLRRLARLREMQMVAAS